MKSTQPHKYALVIDAGSTGNRIHVYRYADDYPIPSFDFEEWKYQKFKPGLSSFEKTPKEAGSSLDQLITFAKEHVPREEWKDTPIQLRATAGMRKVRASNPSAAAKIMESVTNRLAVSPFKFDREWSSIIEGTAEGRYGWITANYLNGFFKKHHEDPSSTSTGVLEMGGESVQLTFVPDAPHIRNIPGDMLDEFAFAGETYPLFVHSWMGYGLEAAQERQDMNYYERTNPCYLKGTVHAYKQAGGEEKHDGSGNFKECYLQVSDLINEGSCEETAGISCTLDGIMVPSMKPENFYLIENFYYTAEFFGNEVLGATNYRQAIEHAGIRFCAVDHETVKSLYPEQDEWHFEKECFGSAYIAAMLDIGFHLDKASDYDRFEVVREIHGIGIDWALGAVMDTIQHSREASGRSFKKGKGVSKTASWLGYFFHRQWFLIISGVYVFIWAIHISRFGRVGLPDFVQRMLAKPRVGAESGLELQGFLHSGGDKDSNDGEGAGSRVLT